jgi:hypothetical protein
MGFGVLFAGLSHKVNECVFPGRVLVRHPITDDIEIVFGLKLGNVAKYRFELRDLSRRGVIHHELKDAGALRSHRFYVYPVGGNEHSTRKGQNRRSAKLPALPTGKAYQGCPMLRH